jgi:hypothetical protein
MSVALAAAATAQMRLNPFPKRAITCLMPANLLKTRLLVPFHLFAIPATLR